MAAHPASTIFVACALWSRLAMPLAEPRPEFHAVTYANLLDGRLAMALGSAEAHHFHPVVMGLGIEANWGWGVDELMDKVRDYVFTRTQEDDLVLVFDSFDVVFVAGEDEIIDKYLEMEARMGIELVYSAETQCSYPERCAEFQNTSTPYRFLNAGVYMGRSRRFRDLFKDSVKGKIVDKAGKKIRAQNWHIQYYLDNQDHVMLDSGCELVSSAFGIDNLFISSRGPDATGLVLEGDRVRNKITNSLPMIIHFPGPGHWSDWRHPTRIGTCPGYEVFRVAGSPALAARMEEQYKQPKFMGLPPWKLSCTQFFTFFDRVAMWISRSGDVFMTIRILFQDNVGLVVCMFLMALLAAVHLYRRQRQSGMPMQTCLPWSSLPRKDNK